MKKLFTFAAALLFTASMMAQTTVFNWSPTESECVGTVIFGTSDFSISTVKIHENTDNITALKLNTGYKFADKKFISIKPADGAFKEGDVVSLSVCFNNSDNTKNATVIIYTPDGQTKLFTSEQGLNGRNAGDPAIQTYTLEADADSIIIARGGNTATFMPDLYVTRPATCEDPELTVSPTEGTGFVGDAIDIAVTSKNHSKPLNAAVTVDGVEAKDGTDYTFSASTGLVQATPLRAGTFVITFSQASNGTYCDAEESATFVISEKAAVTSFTVEGPTSARVGDEITLTAKDFNAAPTRVWWLDASTGDELHEGATYTFTASKYGTFEYLVLARNDFNDPDEESYDYAFGLFGSIDVTIGHNAYLSDLKVNGETIDGFKDDKFEYDLGEIGVYEILNVVATPADAPYATAVVNVAATGVLVSVIAQDQTTIKEYIIHFTRKAASELASISASTTWDFSKTGTNEIKLTDSSLPKKTDEFVYADLLTNPDDSFNAEALAGIQEYVVRDGKYCQGGVLKFKTTVPGKVKLEFSNTGGKDSDTDPRPYRYVAVNKVVNTTVGSRTSTKVESSEISVPAGDILIEGSFEEYVEDTPQYLRVYKVIFTADGGTAIDNIEAGQVVKAIENGQLVIIKNGVRYNAQGSIVR